MNLAIIHPFPFAYPHWGVGGVEPSPTTIERGTPLTGCQPDAERQRTICTPIDTIWEI